MPNYFHTDGEFGALVGQVYSDFPLEDGYVAGSNWFRRNGFPAENYTNKNSEHDIWDEDSLCWISNPDEAELIQAASAALFQLAKVTKRAVIKKARDAFEFGGFDWNGYTFDSNPISQQRIQGAAQLAMVSQAMEQPFQIDWTLADNTVISLNEDQMLAVGVAMGMHIGSAHAKSRTLQAQIESATSAEELDAIQW